MNNVLAAGGVRLVGTKYMFLRADADSAFGKKGQAGCCIFKATQCVIIGTYADGTQPGPFNQVFANMVSFSSFSSSSCFLQWSWCLSRVPFPNPKCVLGGI
jgi:hypothetical protein